MCEYMEAAVNTQRFRCLKPIQQRFSDRLVKTSRQEIFAVFLYCEYLCTHIIK